MNKEDLIDYEQEENKECQILIKEIQKKKF